MDWPAEMTGDLSRAFDIGGNAPKGAGTAFVDSISSPSIRTARMRDGDSYLLRGVIFVRGE